MTQQIQDFLMEGKKNKLKKQITAEMDEEEASNLTQQIEKSYQLGNWLPNATSRITRLSLVTHSSKFSHSKANASAIYAIAAPSNDGFLRSGNIDYQPDVLANAAVLDVFKFLSIRLNDEKTVLEHLESNSELIQQALAIDSMDYDSIRSKLLSIKPKVQNYVTSDLVKQVYFPFSVIDRREQYHLLSILTPPGLLFELKNRVQEIRFSEQTKQAKDDRRHNIYNEIGFEELNDLTAIGFGGANPQNVSILNSQNGGVAYLLPSIPPMLPDKKMKLPKKDFFQELFWSKAYQKQFEFFHRLIQAPVNNKNIKHGLDQIILSIYDHFVLKIWQIRLNQENGWTDQDMYQQLPLYQKWLLDEQYSTQRNDEKQWLLDFQHHFSRWFILCYNAVIIKYTPLNSDSMDYIKTLIKKYAEAV